MTFFDWFKEKSGKGQNAEQKAVIKAVDGAVLVVAGAGTGKTSMITAKAAYLIRETGLKPERLLMLTFSREAARHMKEELEKILPGTQSIAISTFHAFCFDFLQQRAKKMDLFENSAILNELDAAVLLHKELGITPETAKFYVASIEKAKDLSLTPKMYAGHVARLESHLKSLRPNSENWGNEAENARIRLNTLHLEPQTKAIHEEKRKLKEFLDVYEEFDEYSSFLNAWERYEDMKARKKLLDYADLNKHVIDYATKGGDKELAELYDYVIVDEFQDTNRQQFDLLKTLTAKHGRITVVGDENQAIYAFRGAYSNNLEAFKKEFNAASFALTLNYRSTNMVLRSAHRLIQNNYEHPDQAILLKSAECSEGDKVRVLQTMDPKEQARKIIEEIEALSSQGVPYNKIAILFRSHSSSHFLQNALDRRGLPYQIVSGIGFLKRAEIRTALAFLYVVANIEKPRYGADPLWWRLLHYKYGLTVQDSHIIAEAAKRGSIQSVILGTLPGNLSVDGKAKIQALQAKITELRKSKNKTLPDLLFDIYEATGISRWFSHDATTENRLSLLNLRYLHDIALNFQSLHGGELYDFIDYLEILGELGEELEAQQIANTEGVVLMTCHAAKGLEFDHVFLIDLVKDKFPLTRGGMELLIPDELDERYSKFLEEEDGERIVRDLKKIQKEREERRLAYVAFTRARKGLNLCFAKNYGEREREPSAFLTETGFVPENICADLQFVCDDDIKARDILKDTDIERKKAEIKKLLLSTIDSEPTEALINLLMYERLSGHKLLVPSPEAQRVEQEATKILESIMADVPRGVKFNADAIRFSVSSLNTYAECPKKYELMHIFRMPSRQNDYDGEGALGFGSFIHEVLEITVKNNIKSRKELDELAAKIVKNPGYNGADMKRAKKIFDIFWARRGETSGNTIMVEEWFGFNIDGLKFTGKIDRVDLIDAKKNEIEIVDYKTGKTESGKDERALQLLLYALAFQLDPKLKELGLKPKLLTLELLEQEKPRVFELTPDGNMVHMNGSCESANINEIRQKMIELAKSAARDYERGYRTTDNENSCKWCGYRLYCPKWG